MSADRLRTILLISGLILELVAAGFGSRTWVSLPSGQWVANITGAGAACGFAVAGGLSLLAAAFVRGSEPE